MFPSIQQVKTIKPAEQTTEQGFLPEPRLNFAPNGLRTDVTCYANHAHNTQIKTSHLKKILM